MRSLKNTSIGKLTTKKLLKDKHKCKCHIKVEIYPLHLKLKICSEVLGMEQRLEEGSVGSALKPQSASIY